ncbi:family transcriptional regulator : Transcriptional regulator, MarR family OS=Pirellula staleyi (strain ATCC 27377 / DSM 6068 / ICPB 4128) GN=Psta_0585 PE=4 SV=1: MarR_2 [Gemmata massiliana]|uniref:HTH marR-type domain-containing protein n=1 Tax=Gemmata massiliana TaxID=1210884 RepID=A0A6P2CSX5_9BACT|nr:MarR family winged helix-turn-helix transcriptional regulator [Gemmata massiliana]VTR91195.1 family transcriptional regulator : Transcriptional regulator, MarR family OS=Pirellula staleyi (strain ATCC 27377 / DSM 6068 / ICPB 4128) GN=Psta_0585 PE=4 SV=1: MarR_2 [Gemmata massiliana]
MTGHDLAMALRGAYLAMHRRTDAALAEHGITADQFVLIAALAHGEATTQRELARRAASDPNTVRAMILLLEGQKLVVRAPHPTDARARTVALTAKGRRVYEQLWTASESVREQLLATVGEQNAPLLLSLLESVSRGLSSSTDKTEPVTIPVSSPA